MPEEHEITLGYTNNDDGVHLQCSCGWSENLGFFASVVTAAERAAESLRVGHARD